MRSILLHAHDDTGFEARLQAGLDLARTFDAHLTCLQTVAYDVVIPNDPFGVVAGDWTAVSQAAAAQFREATQPRLAGEDVRWNWQVEMGYDGSSMVQHAALNDLALLGPTFPQSGTRTPSPLAGMLAIHCKAPIMVVPETARGIAPEGPAVICWNGSMEAARALRFAVPLLRCASAVHLVSVGAAPETDLHELPASAAAAYLDRHGIDSQIVQIPRSDAPVHDVLRKAAQAREAAFMVMGAYGLPRFVETLFGGVTRSLLVDPPVPVLLTH